MVDNTIPTPAGDVVVPHSFALVQNMEPGRLKILGPFAFYFEISDKSNVNSDMKVFDDTEEFALFIETFSREGEVLWAYFTNRYHYFVPDGGVSIQGEALSAVCRLNEAFRHLFFRKLTESEWVSFLGEELPTSHAARLELFINKYY